MSTYETYFPLLTRARAGGGGGGRCDHPPHEFIWNGFQTAGRTSMKFCIAYGASFSQLLTKNGPGQVRSRSYDVIRGTATYRFFKEIVFSAM